MLSSSLAQEILGTLRAISILGTIGISLPSVNLKVPGVSSTAPDRVPVSARVRPSKRASSSRRRSGSSLPSTNRARFRPRTGELETASCSRLSPLTSRLPENPSFPSA